MYYGKLKEKDEFNNLLEYLKDVKSNDYVQGKVLDLLEAFERIKLDKALYSQLEETMEFITLISYYEGILAGAKLNKLLTE